MSTVSNRSSFISCSAIGREFHLGVPRGGRRESDDRAEIPLPDDERIAQAEILSQAHERVVNGHFAVGVIVARRVAANLCALSSFGVCRQPQLVVHDVQNAALDGFEPVSDVRQSPRRDDRERVIEVSAASFLAERDVGDLIPVVAIRPSADADAGGTLGGAAARGFLSLTVRLGLRRVAGRSRLLLGQLTLPDAEAADRPIV